MVLSHQVTNKESTTGDSVALRTTEVQYREGVRGEIRRLQTYFARQLTRYRVARTVVIVSAALVPVLATVTVVPRWVLAAFGAVAEAAEGIQGLYQFHKSALNAMATANALERVLNRYMTAVAPYTGPIEQAFPLLVDEIETIRNTADETFLQTWQAGPASTVPERSRQVTPLDQRGITPPPSNGA